MSFVKGLRCRECHKEYPIEPLHVCEFCFGPLEVVYNYDDIKKALTREAISKRPPNMWRYKELMPISGEPAVGAQVGFTPLVKADNLARTLGVKELYVKNDAVCFPSLSFKDRVVSVAISKAKEFGFKVAGCASTGNLANSVAANATAANMESFIFIPHDLEQGKIIGTIIYNTNLIGIKGTYDDVNRLCAEIAGKYGWAFVNVNIRPFYAEGCKTYGFEIFEQLGWKAPKHIIVPMAGGSLINKIWKAAQEFHKLGLIPDANMKLYGAQATGCSPITAAVKAGHDLIKPVKPSTIAKSLAIGNPADGFYAIKAMKESGGWGEDVSDEEVVEGIKLLARTEGIFPETAGGVTVGVAKKLIEQGRIPRDESIVISITGNGLKTMEAVSGRVGAPSIIGTKLSEFDELYKKLNK